MIETLKNKPDTISKQRILRNHMQMSDDFYNPNDRNNITQLVYITPVSFLLQTLGRFASENFKSTRLKKIGRHFAARYLVQWFFENFSRIFNPGKIFYFETIHFTKTFTDHQSQLFCLLFL